MKNFLKLFCEYILQALVWILHIVPTKNNQLLFASYHGLQYSCNPRYISRHMAENYAGKFEIVWLFDTPEQYMSLQAQGIKVVRCTNWNKLKYGLTAKISIVNAGQFYSWMPPKKDQLHVDTWHGGGYYKLCGLNETRKDRFDKRLFAKASKNTTYFLSTNQCFTENEIRKDFAYDGDVLNIGFPRNDLFFHCDYIKIHNKICDYFGIGREYKIMMYAPTFRYDDTKQFKMPNFEKLKEAAAARFGGKWAVLTRMHYYDAVASGDQDTYDANYREDMPEMQELLASCDMLISDYSSCIWDYSFTYRPCFLFTPDLEEYTADRGFGIDIYDWGFPVCKTEQELWDAIKNFDPDVFRKAMERHHDNLGSFEHGNATEIMGKLIYDFCFPGQDTGA